jgi:hypothetical protein
MMQDWPASKWMLILGIAGAAYAAYLLLFRRDWPERRKDNRRWRADRRSDESEESDDERRADSDRRNKLDRRER